MRKVKGISIIAISLLLLQIFIPNSSVIGISEAAKFNSDGKVEIQHQVADEDALTWKVILQDPVLEDETATTTIMLGEGMVHQSVEADDVVKVEETGDGYVIETPAKGETYSIDVVTKIVHPERATFELHAELSFSGKTIVAADVFQVEQIDEEQQEQAGEEETKGHTEDRSKTKMDDVDKDGEQETLQEDGADNGDQEEVINHRTDKETNKSLDLTEPSEEAFYGIQHPPFLLSNNPTALAGIMSSHNWPNPGSVNVTKVANDTSNPLQWEVELNVLGKNLQTSSDVVLVFDRSGSMAGNRLIKAKAAANQFVDTLLVPGSSTRIALVEFNANATTSPVFSDSTNKQQLKNQINGIDATGGTNIQAGLHQAKLLLRDSTADVKTIVLLSDGEPTYSFKGNSASSYSWPSNKYSFIINSFDYSDRRGNGSSYNLPTGFLGFGDHRYSVNGFQVTTNGIPTISEARHIINEGFDIYSIGLDVGNGTNASYVLQNSNNKGYYAGGSDDLSPIFNEIAAQLKFAATSAVVTDPLGDMFDLVKDGSYSGANFSVTNGTVAWNDATETFTWDIGNVDENKTYTLKYKVTLDCTKQPQVNTWYKTNKTTTLNYKDFNGQNVAKNFPIPEVKADTSIVTLLGYRVNAAGEPVDGSGNVVSSPEEAQRFFTKQMGVDEFLQDQLAYPTANTPTGYQLQHYGIVQTPILDVCLTVPYGYVNINELPAADVIVKHVDENGADLVPQETLTGNIGAPYTTSEQTITGYVFKEMDPVSAPASGTFTTTEQTVIYVYKKLTGSITINKVDENNASLGGATFTLTGPNGYERTETSVVNEEIVFNNLAWGTYTLKEIKAPAGYRLLTSEITFEITAEDLHHSETVMNSLQDWTIPQTGGVGTIGFYGVGFLLMAGTGWFLIRRRKV